MHITSPTIFMVFLALLLNAFLFSAGCGKTRPTYKDSNMLIEVKVGQEFDIVLKSNPTTGYSWKLARPLDKKMLELVKSKYKAPEGSTLGKGGEEVWTFRGMGKGKTSISLKYVRPWEKDKPPAETEIFKVVVSKK